MNAGPVIGSLLFDNPFPRTSDTLQVQVVDTHAGPLTFQYDWRVNGQLVQTITSTSPTATLDLSQPGFGDRGDVIEVTVTASDGSNTASAAAALTVVASPSELYADYLAAVEVANANYLAAVADRDATLLAAHDAAYEDYQTAIAPANEDWNDAEATAWAIYLDAKEAADETLLAAEAAAWEDYLNVVALIEA
ncbi:MAG: hypothetical protein NZO58_11300, partial [Gemmataceae bacterium]|nr:hypothetical protein [Gemmataceae bacterium]